MFTHSIARRTAAVLAAVALTTLGLSGPAFADSAPVDPTNPATPPTVTADALPTAQMNGVVWTQTVVGNTVYVGGSFTRARPFGSPAGSNEVVRNNLLAYNITTGELIQGFAHDVNGQVRSIARSPDGSRIYITGDFSRVNGEYRVRVAAFDTATGALVPGFRPTLATSGLAVTASNTTVYVGGNFQTAASQTGGTLVPKNYLAAFSASTGALTPFAADASAPVSALAITADGSKLVVGGRFTALSGAPFYGLGAVDPTTGAPLPFPANDQIRNAGDESSINSLYADATGVYGTGYHYGPGGNLEGTFRADPSLGTLTWVADCHGDAYSTFRSGSAVYTASHHHYCGNMGGFPQTEPWSFYYANAFSLAATGVNTPDIYGYEDHPGEPAPSLLNWYPAFVVGTAGGLGQAVWSVSGNDEYVVYAGNFPAVNGALQGGMTRFASPSKAPNKQGPRLQGATFPLLATSHTKGEVRLSFGSNWDRDNETLTYRIYRTAENTTPIYTEAITTPFWKPVSRVFKDVGLALGSSQRYRLTATDAFGNVTRSNWMTVTVNATDDLGAYASDVLDDGAGSYWRLGESSGATMVEDWAGVSNATVGTGVTWGQSGAVGDTNTAAQFSGDANGLIATTSSIPGPQVFTIEAWFKTTSTTGGKIVGFGNNRTGTSTNYDRHVYLDGSGRVLFGVYPGSSQVVSTGTGYNNGQWHHVVGTLSAKGQTLYVDGRRVGTRPEVTSAQAYSGYWRIGGDSPWAGDTWFDGSIDDVSIYPTALTAAQVDQHWVDSGRASNVPPVPADAYGASVQSLEPDLYWRLADTTGTSAVDSSATNNPGIITGTVQRGVTGALSGVSNAAMTFSGAQNRFIRSSVATVSPTTYSQELWFKTTTTSGGKLIGLGDGTGTGTSGNYDRHVYMETDGRLTFGTWTGTANTITSSNAYNNGEWHHLVATQSSPAGMALYVDGSLVGTHPQTAAQPYTGYWRVGGDTTWGPQPWFAGSIDEVAVYPVALTANEIISHYQLGSGTVPNQAPVADFSSTSDDLTANVDSAPSSDPDGTIVSWLWDFGGGATATTPTASHLYASGGTFPVTLTVTDNRGGTASVTKNVTVVAPNVLPHAAFTATATDLTVSVNGTGSTDSDGTIASYAWDFGDGTPVVSGATASHTYAAAGTYPVKLTVTDNRNGQDSSTQSVGVTAPVGPVVLAADAFGRASGSTWGTADIGGAWVHAGTASNFTVADGVGKIAMPAGGSSPRSRLGSLSARDVDATISFSLDKLPNVGTSRVWFTARSTGWNFEYLTKVNIATSGAVTLQLLRKENGTETVVAQVLPGLTVVAGNRYTVRLQAVGSGTTALRTKVWNASATEPDWQVTASDSTASLQTAGGVGVGSYMGTSVTNAPVVVSWDDLRVTTIG